MRIYAILALVVATSGLAFAGIPVSAPEIDPATGVGALTLMGGALLVLRARRKR